MEEFRTKRDAIFGDYARAVISLSGLIHMVVPEPAIEKLLTESFCEMAAEFKDQGLVRFGAPAKEQAIFTIWTLRRTSSLIAKALQLALVDARYRRWRTLGFRRIGRSFGGQRRVQTVRRAKGGENSPKRSKRANHFAPRLFVAIRRAMMGSRRVYDCIA